MSRTEQCTAFISRKGGRGKTTWCPSNAGYLAKRGNKVLVVDFDPQANATPGLGIDPMAVERSMCAAISNPCQFA